MSRIRVLLVDDHPSFAQAAESFLSDIAMLEVLPSANSATEALCRIAAELPDLVLMDVNMPVMNGLDAIRKVRTFAKVPKMVAISLENSEALLAEASRAGADAFVCKRDFGAEISTLLNGLFATEPRLCAGGLP